MDNPHIKIKINEQKEFLIPLTEEIQTPRDVEDYLLISGVVKPPYKMFINNKIIINNLISLKEFKSKELFFHFKNFENFSFKLNDSQGTNNPDLNILDIIKRYEVNKPPKEEKSLSVSSSANFEGSFSPIQTEEAQTFFQDKRKNSDLEEGEVSEDDNIMKALEKSVSNNGRNDKGMVNIVDKEIDEIIEEVDSEEEMSNILVRLSKRVSTPCGNKVVELDEEMKIDDNSNVEQKRLNDRECYENGRKEVANTIVNYKDKYEKHNKSKDSKKSKKKYRDDYEKNRKSSSSSRSRSKEKFDKYKKLSSSRSRERSYYNNDKDRKHSKSKDRIKEKHKERENNENISKSILFENLNKIYKNFSSYNAEPSTEITNFVQKLKLNQTYMEEINTEFTSTIPKIKNEVQTKRKYDIPFHLSFYSIPQLIKFNPNFKLNVILDIDSTLLNTEAPEKTKNYKNNIKNHQIHKIEQMMIYDNMFELRTIFRPGFIEFMKTLEPFSNFYINTMGHINYAREVIKFIHKLTNIKIEEVNISSSDDLEKGLKHTKRFGDDSNFLKTVVILDDTLTAWSKDYLKYLIVSKRYLAFFGRSIDPKFYNSYQYAIILENISIELEETSLGFLDSNSIPYSIEYDYSNNNQLDHLNEIFENIYKIVTITQCSTDKAISLLRSNVLSNCIINFDYLEKTEECKMKLRQIVTALGGSYRKPGPTHYIASTSKYYQLIRYLNTINVKEESVSIVNDKWLFDCYFLFKKVDEKHSDYRIKFFNNN